MKLPLCFVKFLNTGDFKIQMQQEIKPTEFIRFCLRFLIRFLFKYYKGICGKWMGRYINRWADT